MSKEERAEILREFSEAKALVQQLNALTNRIEKAADRAIEAYQTNGNEVTHAAN